MPFNTQDVPSKRRPQGKKERFANLEEMTQKSIDLYRIYGNQNPTPKTKRGRAV